MHQQQQWRDFFHVLNSFFAPSLPPSITACRVVPTRVTLNCKQLCNDRKKKNPYFFKEIRQGLRPLDTKSQKRFWQTWHQNYIVLIFTLLQWLHSLHMTQFCHPHLPFIHMCADTHIQSRWRAHTKIWPNHWHPQMCSFALETVLSPKTNQSLVISTTLFNKYKGWSCKEGKWDNFASKYWCYTSQSDYHWPEIIKQTGRKCPLTFAKVLPTDKSWGLGRFISFPSFAFVLLEERVQNLQGRSDVLRDNICHAIQKKTVCEYLSGIISIRRATKAARTGRCF